MPLKFLSYLFSRHQLTIKVIIIMKNRVWRELCLLSSDQGFPDDSILHYLLKCKNHINHLYAFRKEQYINNHFHHHCHNHDHHRYHHHHQ